VDSDPLNAPLQGAFLALLDDTAPAVRAALLTEFTRRGTVMIPFLQEAARGRDRALAWHAAWFLQELKFSDPVAEFKGFIRSLNYELETGWLLLSRIISPRLDIAACGAALDEFARRCRELVVEPSTARDKCRVLNRVLFHEYGFRGNLEHYTDPRNSFLDQVLARRKGLPLTLSLVYLLVAQRIGLTLEPVGLPGHFVVGCFLDDAPFFVDAFDQGVFRTPAELLAILRQNDVAPKMTDLAPTPVREVLCRCCRNLAKHYAAAEDFPHARLFAELVEEFEATYERHASP
jgi:regulator of sirC expression with transglutaminase-like and TPR domain